MQEWVFAAKEGDNSAWNVLYRQYYPFLFAHALRICGNTPAAKDAVQDTFVAAFLKLDQLKDMAAFGGWVKRILVNTCYRMRQKADNHLSHIPDITDRWWEDEISRKMDDTGNRHRLHATIATLPEALRSTLLLRYFSGFGAYEEMAGILSVPIGTIRSRMNQAKLKLAEHWQQQADAGGRSLQQGEEWNQFYGFTFGGIHRHDDAKNKLIGHLQKNVEIVYTSGKGGAGRHLVENEIIDDRKHGSWLEPVNIVTSGNISIVEARNFNSAEHPNRCPPTVVFVLRREKQMVSHINLHLA